jgi:hypothetical protein
MMIDLTADNGNIDAVAAEESGAVKMHLQGENGLGLALMAVLFCST